MKILVTGDRGYIGPVLSRMLLAHGHEVVGFDIDYYAHCELIPFSCQYPQMIKDIRDIAIDDLVGFDAIIHLAGLSNDPLGELTPNLTHEINYEGTVSLATLARKAGVPRLIYASSQSMYGISNVDMELLEDDSDKNPITSYAKTKWEAELALKAMGDDSFTVVCFRPSTVFGAAPRLRTDIVFNNLVASAYTKNIIEIKSDGTPWRPVVHVQDVCSAFIAGLHAPRLLVAGESFNVGVPHGNYTVRQLAEAVHEVLPACRIVYTGEHGLDSRTYRVSFNKILTQLKDYYEPSWCLLKGAEELLKLFKASKFNLDVFEGMKTNRLRRINYLIQQGHLNASLRRTATEMLAY